MQKRSCRQSTPSRRSTSIQLTRRGNTGGTFTIVCRSVSRRASTRAAVIKRGSKGERSRRDPRYLTLLPAIAIAALLLSTIRPPPRPRLVWNAFESVPLSLSTVQLADTLAVTDLVVALPPEPLRSFCLSCSSDQARPCPARAVSVSGRPPSSASMDSQSVQRSRATAVVARCPIWARAVEPAHKARCSS